jgi:hypothetical protein
MVWRAAALALMVAIAAGLASGVDYGWAQQAVGQSFPPLPNSGYIVGRPATDKDVADGNAVFALQAYGIPFGKPLDVVIPQYAYLTKKGQQPVPVVVVQAEQGKAIKIFGVRDANGKATTAREYELRLLGTRPPD